MLRIIIEKERINGEYINEKGEVKYPYRLFHILMKTRFIKVQA